MPRVEFVSPEGFRPDGRRPGELRTFHAELGVLPQADGSAMVRQGNTRVLASVMGPKVAEERRLARHDRCTIVCEYGQAAFSRATGRRRAGGDRMTRDVSSMLQQSVETVVMGTLFPGTQIDVHVEVLQHDGSVRAAALNAVTLALMDAGVPMRDFLCAVTVGFLDGHAVLDVNQSESGGFGPEVTMGVLPRSKEIITLLLESRIPAEHAAKCIELAQHGTELVFAKMDDVVRKHVAQRALLRGAAQA